MSINRINFWCKSVLDTRYVCSSYQLLEWSLHGSLLSSSLCHCQSSLLRQVIGIHSVTSGTCWKAQQIRMGLTASPHEGHDLVLKYLKKCLYRPIKSYKIQLLELMGGPEAHLFVPLLYYYLSRPGSWEPFKILLFIEHSLEIQQILFPKFQSEGYFSK